MWAAGHGQSDCLQLLINVGAELNSQTTNVRGHDQAMIFFNLNMR